MPRTFVNCAKNIFWPWRYDVNSAYFEFTQSDTLFTMTVRRDLLVSHCKQTETLSIGVKWNK